MVYAKILHVQCCVDETLIEQHLNEQPTNLNDCNDTLMLTQHCINVSGPAHF